jgi:glycosyltransferase involved in cell wall biosynthesis
MNSQIRIDIVVPVYNEQETLAIQIATLHNYLSQFENVASCIVIANNGSQDKTESIALELIEKYANVKYSFTPELGPGKILKRCWTESRADIVGYMDLDLATSLHHVIEVIELLSDDSCDIVNGSRLLPNSQVIGRRALRTISSIVFNKVLKIVFGTKITDGMCGFKFFKRDVIDELALSEIEHDGWFASASFLLVAEKRKFRIREIPVVWHDDAKSKVKIARLSLEYLRNIAALKKSRHFNSGN